MHFRPDKPFNQLPDLPPTTDLETSRVLKATTRAGRALAELKGRTHTIPNPTILLNTVALQEAKLSSEIENIFTTNDELYRGLAANGTKLEEIPWHFRDLRWVSYDLKNFDFVVERVVAAIRKRANPPEHFRIISGS